MSSTNLGPAVTQTQNVQPLGGTFDAAGKLLQVVGPGGSVALDPNAATLGIVGGAIDGQPIMTAALLPKWRKALARVVSGQGNGRILCIGDSTTVGTGSVAGGAGPGVKNASYPTLTASLLSGIGLAASSQNCFGDFGYGANAPTYDSRFVLGNWAFGSPNNMAGQCYTAGATTASPLSFTPSINTDTCEIYYLTGSTGSFNANINGGGNTLVNTAGGNGVSKVTITGALGANVYNCLWASGSNVFICGFIAYNSAVKQVHVVNMGRGGGKAGDINGAFPAASNHIAAIAPDLTIIQIGINDWTTATSLGSYAASVQTVITGALAVGDCMLSSPIYTNPASVASAAQTPYTAALQSLAITNGIPFVDTNYRLGGFAAGNANGMYYTDGVHGSALGYADEARNLLKLLNV